MALVIGFSSCPDKLNTWLFLELVDFDLDFDNSRNTTAWIWHLPIHFVLSELTKYRASSSIFYNSFQPPTTGTHRRQTMSLPVKHITRQLKLVIPGAIITYYLGTISSIWELLAEEGSWGRCVDCLSAAKSRPYCARGTHYWFDILLFFFAWFIGDGDVFTGL